MRGRVNQVYKSLSYMEARRRKEPRQVNLSNKQLNGTISLDAANFRCYRLGTSVHAALAACGGGGGKEDVAEQTWDCMAENAEDSEVFEQSMLMMLPTASNHIYCLVSDTAGYGTLSRRNRIVGTVGKELRAVMPWMAPK